MAPEAKKNVQLVEISVANLIEALPDALIVADESGTVCLVNEQSEWLFGRSRTELVGMQIEALMPDRFRRTHVKDRQLFADNPSVRAMGHDKIAILAVNRNGVEVPVSIALAPLMTQSGMFVIATIRRT